MDSASWAVQACLLELRDYLAMAISGLTVIPEWPGANERLVYPSATLFSGAVQTKNRSPEQIAITQPDGDNKVTVTQVVGEHDFKLQVDLWCATRQERDVVLGQVIAAINAQCQAPTGEDRPAGLSLQLETYFGEWARFDLDGSRYVDDEAAAQRQERRAKLDLLVNCRALNQRTYYAMKSIQVGVGVATTDPTDIDLETIF